MDGLKLPGRLALHRAIADVAPVLHTGPVDRVRQRIGFTLRLADARTEPNRTQHATAVGQHFSGLEPGAGVEDLARQAGGAPPARPGVALLLPVRGGRPG